MPDVRGVSQAASAATSFTVSKPTGTVSGDVMYLLQVSNSIDDADLGTPTGGATWTLVTTLGADSSFCIAKLWRKTAGGSEPSTYTLTQGSPDDSVAIVISLVDASTSAPVVATDLGDFGTTTISTPSTTPTGPSDIDLRFVAAYGVPSGTTWTPPAGYTERADIQSADNPTASLATKALSGSGATGTQNFTISSAPTRWRSITVTVTGTQTNVGVNDTGSATQSLAVAGTTSLADTGAATDTFLAARAVPLTDTATAADALAASAAIVLADTGTAVDTGANGQPIFFPEVGAAADTITAAVTGAALPQAGAASDAVTVTASAALTNAATALDALTYSEVLFPVVGDTAAAEDALTFVDVHDRDAVAGPPRRGWSARPPTL
ncbi:hypothetical protein [Streptosporangium roseum]|uniref:hypothetical protein n=1 Tax=Streptosporangium roseum TaxID=2001 RepID=UPI0004CC9E41|nr:hypothetical protein [Streptosporangium roseum]